MSDSLLQQREAASANGVRAFFTSPVAIFLTALIIRATYWWWRTNISGVFAEDVRNVVGNEAWNIASSIVAGKGYSSPFAIDTGPTAWITPVYPYLMAGILKLFGGASHPTVAAAAALNELFSALTCVPIYFVGKRMGGRFLGAVAAWLWCIHPLSISIAYEWLWYTSLSALLVAWILRLTMELAESDKRSHWTGYGLLWGMSLLTNASVLALAPFVFAWMIWKRKKSNRGSVRLPAWAALVAVLVCSPWVIRNYMAFHQFLPLRSNFGFELWIGNLPGPVDLDADGAMLVRLGEIRYSQERGRETIQFLSSHPKTAGRFVWERFLITWVGHEHPILKLIQKSNLHRIEIVMYFGLSILALAGGLFLFRAQSEFRWLVVLHPLIFPIVYYITHIAPHYRLPIDPVLVILAAVALTRVACAGVPRPVSA